MADDTPDTPKTEAKPAPKPRARRAVAKPAANEPAVSKAKPDTPKAKAPPKPRSSKRNASPTAAATRTAKTPATKTRKAATKAGSAAAKATDKVGGKWGAAAIGAGVVAVAGAATAALLLRGSTPADGKPKKGAKQADGTDSSKSFEAGIADEGTAPN